MEIMITIILPDEITTQDAANAIRNAGERCAGQIEQEILEFPLEIDENIQMGNDVEDVEVTMIRME